jgi:putative DNA-invertase from lambdoid prophage Rac
MGNDLTERYLDRSKETAMSGREPCPTCGRAFIEVDRALISERTKQGLEKARQAGKRLGRPRAENAPDGAIVQELRNAGRSWGQIVRKLGCTRSAAQRALQRLVVSKNPAE